jgi:hypothetical protein
MLHHQLPKGNEGVNAELLPFLRTVKFLRSEVGETGLRRHVASPHALRDLEELIDAYYTVCSNTGCP